MKDQDSLFDCVTQSETNQKTRKTVKSSSERAKKWRLAHPEKVRKYNKARQLKTREHVRKWEKAHPEKVRKKLQKWKKANPKRRCAHSSKWVKSNPEKATAIKIRHAGLKRNAQGRCTAIQLQYRIAFYGGRCWMCGATATSIDHVKPLTKGGSNWPSNLRPACHSCNSRKNCAWLNPFQNLAEFLNKLKEMN